MWHTVLCVPSHAHADRTPLQERIDGAVQQLAADAYEQALAHMRNNREAIDRIVELLVERETLTGDEFRSILSEYTEIPEENLPSVSSQVGESAVAAFEPPAEQA